MDEEPKFKKPEKKPDQGNQGPDEPQGSRSLSDDLLRGGMAIAEFLFGERTERARRKVFHLAETSRLPIFKLGSTLCLRKSTFFAWVSQYEQRGWPSKAQPKKGEAPPIGSKGADDKEPDDEEGR